VKQRPAGYRSPRWLAHHDCCLKREIENKVGHVQRLEALLCSRPQKMDELTAQVDQLRQQNRRLDAEAQQGMTAE
jgi:polyhydroxyalkanoate synthesis regulator phasin